MTRKLIILGTTLLVLVGLFAAAGIAQAQGPSIPNVQRPATAPYCGTGSLGGMRFGFGDTNMLTVIAKLLGIAPEDLAAQLRSGKSLLDVAKEYDKTTEDLVNAMVAARSEQLNAAVKAGRITQEQADQIIQTMRDNMTRMLENGTCGTKCLNASAGPQAPAGRRGGMMGGRWSGNATGGGMMGNRGNTTPSN